MSLDLERTRLCFQKLDRQLLKLAKKQSAENVHKFRTSSRRVETAAEALLPANRSRQQLLRDLSRLRKKAGQLRDLDTQLAALRTIKNPEANGQKSKLLQALLDERETREKKLAKALDKQVLSAIRKNLKRAARKLPENAEPLAVSLSRLAQLGRDHTPVTEKTLHKYRILGKRARYLAELSEPDPEAERVVQQLKQMQDVIGDWHDWLQLTNRAEEILGGVKDSALVAMLRNLARAKFRQAAERVIEARTALAGKRVGLVSAPAAPGRKLAPTRASKATAAVA